MSKLRVTVLGGGHWGTALAHLAARKGHPVTLWAREAEVVAGINEQHINPVFLKDVVLPDSLRAKARSGPRRRCSRRCRLSWRARCAGRLREGRR